MKQTNFITVVLFLFISGVPLPPLKLGHSDCALKADEGPCKAIHVRFYFNIQSRECETFEYGGCHGNANNFLTLEECQNKCVVTGQYPFSSSSISSSNCHPQTFHLNYFRFCKQTFWIWKDKL
uniref:BPTI/Kunitz inhibitor domain-containing protein n=1 Tax=Pavo cristatus TaxID=9049 RepID=A0A8C9LCN4_PAVCR